MNNIIDYDIYIMTKKEKMLYISIAALIIFVVAYIFYRSIIFSLLLTPLAFFYPKIKTKEIIAKRKNDLNIQFKDMLYSLSSSISAGKSVESAMSDVLKDLSLIYPDKNTYIVIETELILRKISTNEPIENAFADLAKRSHLEDFENFSDVFQACKRSGGNIIEIIRNTSNIISDKIEITQEIETMLTERKLESKVLNLFPIGIVLMLSLCANDYMEPVFSTMQGKIAMTVAIGMFIVSYFVSKKIMDINV